MESVFAQGDKGIVLECYRTKEFVLSREPHMNKKITKKIQKDVYHESVGLSPLSYELASVHTSPFKSSRAKTDSMEENHTTRKKRKKVKFNICACNDEVIDENYKQKYTPRTWQSITNLYRDTDTTQVWMDPKNGPVAINKTKRPKGLPSNDVIVANGNANDNKYGRKSKSKTRKEYNKQEKNQMISNGMEIQARWISKDRDYAPHELSLLNPLRNSRSNRKEAIENLKFDKKPKLKRTHQDSIDNDQNMNSSNYRSIKPTERKCAKGPCLEAAKKEIRNFLCRCDNKKTQPQSPTNECTNATCKLSRSSLGFNSVIKLKDKLLCICNKYSEKFVHSKLYNSTCVEGKCTEAAQSHNYNFMCKCDRNNVVKECSEDTCGKYTKINSNNNNTHLINGDGRLSNRKLSHLKKGSTKLEIWQSAPKQNNETKNRITEHENEQTGEPFFEVQVNPKDMCLLNPMELKEHLKKYRTRGRSELKCICPSRGILRAGELCSSGVCKKAYKNRQTNFNCWCEKKIVECGDSTCDIQNLRNVRPKRKNIKYANITNHNKPILEMQLDMDKMCVVNPKEIQEKIIDNINADEICSSGICRDASLNRKIPIYCRCIGKKMNLGLTECTENTCKNPSRKKRSKFCILCTRICSKSENWSSQNRDGHARRSRRRPVYELGSNKLCRGKICSKSDNLRNYNTRSDYMKHLPNCDCRECKDNIKYEPKVLSTAHVNKEIKLKGNGNRPRQRIKSGNSYSNGNVNNNEFINMRSQTEEIEKGKTEDVRCICAHACECNIKESKSESQKYRDEYKARKKKQRNKIISQRQFKKDLKRRAKLERKREKEAAKLRLKEIKLMKKKMEEQPLDTNFCTAFLLGTLKIVLRTIGRILSIIMTIIKDPKGSFWYIRDRVTDPEGTFKKVKKWFDDAIIIKKLQIAETVRGSDTLTILADHFLDTGFYQSFADKGRTKKEQMEFERKSKARKRRIRKREQQAISSCRHMLLTTLRQTPCLWVYHICPNFYPQCLSLLAFMRNFTNILMFLAAFLCWTPCIVSMELCRAIMCCFFCTH